MPFLSPSPSSATASTTSSASNSSLKQNRFLRPGPATSPPTPSLNHFTSSGASSSSSTGSAPKNAFLSSRESGLALSDAAAVVATATAAFSPAAAAAASTPVEEFPALGASVASTHAAGAVGAAYKTALLAKIKQQHLDEQARLQKALQREVEANQHRQRQLELAAKRERHVAALTHDAAGIAYDDDTPAAADDDY
jgi:hypothetical protein